MQAVHTLMLKAFGVVRYSRTASRNLVAKATTVDPRASVLQAFSELGVDQHPVTFAPVAERVTGTATAKIPSQVPEAIGQEVISREPTSREPMAQEPEARPSRVIAAASPISAPKPIRSRTAERAEFVLPTADLERFQNSKMFQHLHLLLLGSKAPEASQPVVDNAVVSDTSLYLEAPDKDKLKLGALSVLRQTWRAKRQAWLAIRLWRKTNA